MGFIDKILDTMNLNPDDEDDFDNDDYYFDDEPEETHKSRFSRKEADEEPVSKKESAPKEKAVKSQSKITPISKSSRKQGAARIEITETLLNGRTVVINMEGLNVDTAQRIIDFTSGSTYALHGNLQKISNFIFLATPNGVDISGDIQNIMDSFDIPGASY